MLECRTAFAQRGKHEADIYGHNTRYAHYCKEKKITLLLKPKTEESKLKRLAAVHKVCKHHCSKCK